MIKAIIASVLTGLAITAIVNAHGPIAAMATFEFLPSDIAELAGWWQADDLNGNGDGSSGYSDGNAVQTWVDKKAANNWSQLTAGNKPTYESDGGSTINGRAVVRFDGTDDYMGISDTDVFTMSSGGVERGTSFYIVARFDDVTTTSQVALSKDYNPGTPAREWAIGIFSANQLRFFLKDDAAGGEQIGRNDDGFSSTGVFIVGFIYDGSAASSGMDIRIDGAVSDDSSADAGVYDGVTDNTSAAIGLGCRFTGALGVANNFMNFDVGEVLFFSKALSAGEIASVEAYLNGRWASF